MLKSLQTRINENQPLWKAIDNLNRSHKKATTRYKSRIESILNDTSHQYFITFTLNDTYINLKHDTIIRKIKEALYSASNYIFNADYGKTFGRLHYHALVGYDFILDYTTITSIYKYGTIDFIPIHTKDEKSIREYILKQQLHMEKQTATKIYVSRQKRSSKL